MRDVPSRPAPRSKTVSASTKADRSAFGESKRDKRQIKHSAFVSKIEKDPSKKARRRRPNKKLVATLDSLADALPDVEDEPTTNTENGQFNIIRHKTVKTRPGAMKRKEKLEKGERERFTKNLAEMSKPAAPAATSNANVASDSTTSRFQALRAFISGTLDRFPEQKKAET
ncbi:hypothetical protein UCRPC4_g01465 [Phaeomoniella chlamydospora]|uniref:Ribosome biogenesis protein SLX9 n=1 Tax=Phaeomoniella chlamydospora TaxID=158046 RepID=A0A0G2EWF9_PHACM|nr:hypothetical protein UCRPC4_g01465 [Phaeomoniella chlamydospora]